MQTFQPNLYMPTGTIDFYHLISLSLTSAGLHMDVKEQISDWLHL